MALRNGCIPQTEALSFYVLRNGMLLYVGRGKTRRPARFNSCTEAEGFIKRDRNRLFQQEHSYLREEYKIFETHTDLSQEQ